MSQRTRILIVAGALLLVVVILAVVGLATPSQSAQAPLGSVATPQPGMIHLYVDGAFAANVSPADLQQLPAASFTDSEQGKVQSGRWLRDVVRLYVKENKLSPNSQITIAGSRKGTEQKSATVTWAETLNPANNLELSFSNDGQSVKLASIMNRLSTRDQWVQGVERIDVQTKP